MNYFAGNTRQKLINYCNQILKKNKFPIVNYIIENKKDNHYQIYNEYNNLLENIDSNYKIAVKLSSLNFDSSLVKKLIHKYRTKTIPIIIDAEDNRNYESYRSLTNQLMYEYNSDEINIIKTYQMYRKDSLDELRDDLKLMKNSNKILFPKIVRGAYYNSEKNDGHLFIKKEDTDNNYNNALLECYNMNNKYNMVASHNKESLKLASYLNKNNIFSFAHLLGMNEEFMNKFKKSNIVYTYIPYGPYTEMIPYLTRRLYENIDSFKYIFT